jgi:hypothetical protein
MTIMLRETTRIRANPVVVTATVADEDILLNPVRSEYYSLSHVSRRVWALVQTPISVSALRDAIVAEYDIDAESALDDLRELMTSMSEAGLVIVDDAPAA